MDIVILGVSIMCFSILFLTHKLTSIRIHPQKETPIDLFVSDVAL